MSRELKQREAAWLAKERSEGSTVAELSAELGLACHGIFLKGTSNVDHCRGEAGLRVGVEQGSHQRILKRHHDSSSASIAVGASNFDPPSLIAGNRDGLAIHRPKLSSCRHDNKTTAIRHFGVRGTARLAFVDANLPAKLSRHLRKEFGARGLGDPLLECPALQTAQRAIALAAIWVDASLAKHPTPRCDGIA